MNETENSFQLEYSLKNTNNYKQAIDCTTSDIVNIYATLIIGYIKFYFETVKIKEYSYFKYVLLRGLHTITHVFNILLFYTKNVNLAYYHCQKSYYYYIEFISQITNVQHSFLQLNSKDAIMYVYKQTLFELNNDYNKKKDCDKDALKLNQFNTYYKILNTCIESIIKNDIRSYKNEYLSDLEKLANKIISLPFLNVNAFSILLETMSHENISLDVFFNITSLLIKKYNKISFVNIENKIKDAEFSIYIIQPPDIFVNWILNS